MSPVYFRAPCRAEPQPGKLLYELPPDGSPDSAAPLARLAELLRGGSDVADLIEQAILSGGKVKHWARDGSSGIPPVAPRNLARLVRPFAMCAAPSLAEAVALDRALAELLARRAFVTDDLASIFAL